MIKNIEFSTLDLLYEGLEEYFTHNHNSVYMKDQIFDFLKKTFIFCNLEITSNKDDVWNRYLWIILDYYATKKKLTLVFKDNEIELISNNKKQIIKKPDFSLNTKTKYKDLSGFIQPMKCVHN